MAGRIQFGPQQTEITLRSGQNVPLVRLKERAAARAIDLVPAGFALVLATVLMGVLGVRQSRHWRRVRTIRVAACAAGHRVRGAVLDRRL